MNVRTKRIIAVFELVIVIALIAWALCPRSIDQALGIDREAVTQVHVTLTGQEETREVTLNPDDPAYGELLALLEEQTYIPLYLDKDNRSVILDYEGNLTFYQGEAAYGMTFSGDKPIWFVGSGMRDRSFRTAGGEAFQQEILDFLLAQSGDSPS